MAGVVMLAMAGCAREESITTANREIEVFASQSVGETRVEFVDDDNVTHALWEMGDAIGLYTTDNENAEYDIASLEDGVAQFKPAVNGISAADGKSVYAYYPYSSRSSSINRVAVETPHGDFDNIHPFVYAKGTVENGKVYLRFRHPFAYIKLTITKESLPADWNGSTIRYVTIRSTENIRVGGTFDLESGTFDDDGYEYLSSKVEHDLSREAWTVYLPVLPQSDEAFITVSVSSSTNGYDSRTVFSSTVPEGGLQAGHLYSLTTAAAGTEPEPDDPDTPEDPETPNWGEEFFHRSLVMRFTATWCGYCPIMGESIRMAQEALPGKLEVVALHDGGSNYYFSPAQTLMAQYYITGLPTSIVDGRVEILNYDSWYASMLIEDAVYEAEDLYPAVTGIGFTSTLSGQNLTADISVYARVADDYKVTVLLLEDGIIGPQNGYGDRYVHDNIARMALTDISGQSFRTSTDDSVYKFTCTATVPSSYNRDNLRLLVYVQRSFGNRNKVQSGNYGNYYVDNCTSGKIGIAVAPDTEDGLSSEGNEDVTSGSDIIM